MITDRRAAELCVALYDISDFTKPNPIFAVIDDGSDDGVVWAIAHEADCDVIALRGSVTPGDWARDTFATPYIGHRRDLGPVHHGFYLGLDNAWDDMKCHLRPGMPVATIGHSLGAARATLLAAIMLDEHAPPALSVLFGEPMSGFQQLTDFLKPVPARSYRNGDGANHDPIPSLPFPIPPLRYRRRTALSDVITDHVDPNDEGPFVFHHMPLYAAAVSLIPQP